MGPQRGAAGPVRVRDRPGMEFTTIQVDIDGPRGSIALNRPEKLNPLSTVTLSELIGAADYFDARPEVKVVVVSGRGRAFSAGADLAAFGGGGGGGGSAGSGEATGGGARAGGDGGQGSTAGGGGQGGAGGISTVPASREGADVGRRMAEAIETMRAVTVARLHGHVVGGGVVLASACDLRVAAEDARFSIPEVDLGIPLAWGGIPRLVREIGPALTKELVMTCRPFGAEEARAAGFLNTVVPAARLDQAVDDLVELLLTKSALTLAATKAHVNAVTEAMGGHRPGVE